jgi:hypothetical protein
MYKDQFFFFEKIVQWGQFGAFCIFILSGAYFGYVWIKVKDRSSMQSESMIYIENKNTEPPALIENIFTSSKILAFPDISKDLLYLGTSSRPDHALAESKKVLFYLPGSKEKIEWEAGKKMYLTYAPKGQLAVSAEETVFAIKPLRLAGKDIALQLHMNIPGIDASKRLIYLKEVSDIEKMQYLKEEILQHPAYKVLSQSSVLEPDRLYEYDDSLVLDQKKGMFRLSVGQNSFFVKVGSWLLFDEGKWKDCADGRASGPLAVVHALSSNKLEIDFWDEGGYLKMPLSINVQKVPILPIRCEEIFSDIKLRTPNSVSLKIDRKTIFLKKGDWLIKASTGWKPIKTVEEKERCLKRGYKDDLFVFSRIEKQQNGYFFKGYLFDVFRTNVTEVKIPLASKRLNQQKKVISKP